MSSLIFILLVAVTVIYITHQKKMKVREIQSHVGIEHSFLIKTKTLKLITDKVKSQAEYSNKSLYRITLFAFVFMIPGGVIGIFFRNMQLGLILSILLGLIPFVSLFLAERKKQKIILREIVPLITTIDWEYQNNKNTSKALNLAKKNCPDIILDPYERMLKKIGAGMQISKALRDLGIETRCSVFLSMSGIFAAQETRNDTSAFQASLKELLKSIVKTNNRLSDVDANLNKKRIFLIILLATNVIIFFLSFRLMKDPIAFFSSQQGSNALIIGFLVMLIPFVIYFMSAIRRRF